GRHRSLHSFPTRRSSDLSFFALRGFEVATGRELPTRSDEDALAVVVLGQDLKRELFGHGRAVGEWVRIGDRRMRVIGVLADVGEDRKSTRLNSSHVKISY